MCLRSLVVTKITDFPNMHYKRTMKTYFPNKFFYIRTHTNTTHAYMHTRTHACTHTHCVQVFCAIDCTRKKIRCLKTNL